ncbi:MAG: beta-lactamase family protein [Bacteroidetes bacterium]|jgi:CubicO group peptidase (beta-lactamase class C family)|nr:beta-lactamase family protein [Bacteroidota bacterium]MBT3747761.1 beta-lactamase family protein [Bacteroidota bacterium]MBT4401188.1 beta-lactamase family protein [Bacteroidota bacterium]MBT4411127.1 beta-lactamase family protein [Bacteroidota bacterium]MBT5424942.1 beta-lactamase family protein [Bacteroidota bacterium]
MKNIFSLLLFSLIILSSGFAQTQSINNSPPLSKAKPEQVGMSSERLALIDAMCKETVASEDIPGIVVLVARKGKIVLNKAYGMADSQAGRAMKTDDIFRIASQTKAITSTAVMMLWEEGKFRLDDPISRYIPEFKNPQVLNNFRYSDTSYTTIPAKREITIRDLLSHKSGIGYGMIDADERFTMIYQKAGIIDAFTTENITIEENIKKLAKLPLHHNPGEDFTYSEGLDVLGYFIEIISGMPFDKFLRERLLDPLGMHDTWFYLPDEIADRLAPVQYPLDGEWQRFPKTLYDPDYPISGAKRFFAGGAGLSSTAKDYATFLQMYLNKGELNGVRILSRTTVDVILSNQIGDIWEGRDSHFGLAFSVLNQLGEDMGGRGSNGTFDWSGYFNTQYFADPVEQIIGIMMKQTQGNYTDNTAWKFRQLVFQAIDD